MSVTHHLRPAGTPIGVSPRTPLPVGYGDNAQVDAFGRLRVSDPVTMFDSSQEYNAHPLLFQNVLAGSGAITHSAIMNHSILTTGGADADARAFRQSKAYWRYQPGKSQLIKMTGTLLYSGTHAGGSFAQMGYGDDNNGIFLRLDAGGLSVVRRSNVTGPTVETVVRQTNWNLDKMDGSSLSGILVDPEKSQILVIDLQWLAVGRVRIGLQIDGQTFFVHQFTQANEGTGPYMRTACLPVRWEVLNDGAGANVSMEAICVSIESEGGIQNAVGYHFRMSTGGVQVSCPNTVALRPLISFRCRDVLNGQTYRGHILPQRIHTLVSTNGAYWELLWNPTLTGATFANLVSDEDSGAEFDLAATAVTGGIAIGAGYWGAGQGSSRTSGEAGVQTRKILSRTYAGERDVLTLAARGVGGTAAIAAAIEFQELY